MATSIQDVFSSLQKADIFFRLENDEEGFYLSIINRQIYPRVWADHFADGKIEVIAETSEHLLNRTVAVSEKDWSERFSGESIDEVIQELIEWMVTKNIKITWKI